MVTKKDKELILDAFKMVDVKKLDIENSNPSHVKWFRFGSYNGLMIASEIIKNLPEPKIKNKKVVD